MTGTTTIVQMESRREMHGRVLSLQTVLLGGSAAFGGPLLGWIADAVGARALMLTGGVVCLGAAAYGAMATTRLQRTVTTPTMPG
jgi:MFS family permease